MLPSPIGSGFVGSNASELPPRIGITSYLERAQTGVWDVRAVFLPQVYVDGVTDAGGIAVVLPPQPVDDARIQATLDGIDGLVLAGGVDVDPARYGAEAHQATDAPRHDRDEWEIALLQAAIARDLPILGICRGLQVMAVALGGTLHQHLPDVVGHDEYRPAPAQFGTASVAIESESRLSRVLGANVRVPVYHHQALDEVPASMRVTARSNDGIAEAVELPGLQYGIAVQWHPEEEARDRRLFADFIEAVRASRTS